MNYNSVKKKKEKNRTRDKNIFTSLLLHCNFSKKKFTTQVINLFLI